MKKVLILILLAIFCMLAFSGCASDQSGLTVSAASSLRDAALELKSIYEKNNPKVNITFNFASSGTLQKQIEQGAPVDLFISADKEKMDLLMDAGLIMESSRTDLVTNDLVLISDKKSTLSNFSDLILPEVKKVSIGTPESVPAGRYAKETLIAQNIWDDVEPKLVLAKDVRQVLTYVETGNVEAGLVYRTDAIISDNCKVVATAPANSHEPIIYPTAIIKGSKEETAAKEFLSFLVSDAAVEVFEKHGFTPANEN